MRINTTALIRSANATVWFVAVSAVASEMYLPLKNFFVGVARHHWTGKSIFALGIFAILYLVSFKMKESDNPEKNIARLMASTILATLLVLAYFIWHFLSA